MDFIPPYFRILVQQIDGDHRRSDTRQASQRQVHKSLHLGMG